MRITLQLDPARPLNWRALNEVQTLLYRRVADADRAVLGLGVRHTTEAPQFDAHGRASDWTFGHLAYDLLERLEPLCSRHPAHTGFATAAWFVPRWVLEWTPGRLQLHVHPEDEQEGRALVERLFAPAAHATASAQPLLWRETVDEAHYLARCAELMRHIHRGDIYEVNYCTERVADAPGLDPFRAFERLLHRSQAAFAGFLRSGDHFALCASPERFLAFRDKRVMGQPMKGTRPRSADPTEDLRLAMELANDPKERSENIMALDVMRNDLSRIAASGSVQVEELCAVHAHARVHQMVSTVSARLREGHTAYDAVLAAFPMASMTGAPKYRAMQLIDAAEEQRRGLFSGSLGFFAPDGTADLNVVIRTVLYDAASGRASLTTGSALTATCDPRQEWAECQLKARSVIEALQP